MFGFISLSSRQISPCSGFRWKQKWPKGRGGGLQYSGRFGWEDIYRHSASVAAKHTQQHDFGPRLIQAHVTYWIPERDSSPSARMQRKTILLLFQTCGLEQKNKQTCLISSLANYSQAATAFTLLTGVKPYLVTHLSPGPMDSWLQSINVAWSIFCWELAQLLQNEDPNLLITQQYWGYVTNLTHTLSHVSAASLPSFCFPDEHMHALTCIFAQTTCCGAQEGLLH